MYLSILQPQVGCERTAVCERPHDDTYGDHQWLWRLFPSPPGTPRDFLFRRQDVQGVPQYHIVSAREPQSPGPAWQLRVRAYEPQLAQGDRLSFDLTACPSVRRPHNGKSRRHDVVMDAKKNLLAQHGLKQWRDLPPQDRPPLYALVQQTCTAWLAERGARNGFVLDDASCTVSSYRQLGRETQEEETLKFSSVDLAGELTVTEPQAFTAMLRHGLGSAKAFGCGLMLVRRSV